MRDQVDVVIVGAGFAGMYAIHTLRGLGLSVRCFDVASDVGGTWYWNRYPGARCDVPSLEYSYSFDAELEQEWEWSERYAPQPEILTYAGHVADRFDLRRDITFETRVDDVVWDEATSRWHVGTDGGHALAARFVVMATGCLSNANRPDITGADDFAGVTAHTGAWPHDGLDVAGKRVGVIGTGSSAIQSIPILAEAAEHLTVFQRTATYSVPALNRPLSDDEVADIKGRYPAFRDANRQQTGAFGSENGRVDAAVADRGVETVVADLEHRWNEVGGFAVLGVANDFVLDPESNAIAAQFVRDKIAGLVDDPDTARKLQPDQVIGCKRLVLDSGYYETFNRPNVDLVHLPDEPIRRITATGVEVGDGDDTAREVELDVLVYATGFDAMTGALLGIDPVGRDGLPLSDAWAAGPTNYLGLQVPGFPNMFTVTGPGSPSVLTNMIMSIEQHIEWIGAAIAAIDAEALTTIEPTPEAADRWVGHVNAIADFTLFPQCNSWYLGANIPGKTRVFMPLLGFPDYVTECDRVVAAGYEGFARA